MALELKLRTRGCGDIMEFTQEASRAVASSKVREGVATFFVVGSTAALTTIEFEPGLVADMRDAAERLFPEGLGYEHHKRWGDGNGHSHVRAAFIGPSVSVPISEGKMTLGTWQQLVLLEYDNRPRERVVVVQIIGK